MSSIFTIMLSDEDDDDKKTEKKHYVVIPKSSIHSALEFRDIPDQNLTILSEDCSHKVKQVTQIAAQFMHKSGRSCLTTKDVDAALDVCNGFKTYGQNKTDSRESTRIDIAKNLTLKEEFPTLPLSAVNVQWVSVGRVPASITGASLTSSVTATAAGQSLDRTIRISDLYVSDKSAASVASDDGNEIHENLAEYYEAVIEAIMSNAEECSSEALKDLRKNPKIFPLLPHFFNFVDKEIRVLNHELKEVQKLFNFIKALMENQFMYLGHDATLNPLICSVLYCIIGPLEHTPDLAKNHWEARDEASELLKNIISQWATPVNSQYEHTLPKLEKVFRDLNKPIWSLYGAVVGISALGDDAVEKALHPYIPKLTRHINEILQNHFANGMNKMNDITTAPFRLIDEAQRLRAVLSNAVETYMKYTNDASSMESSCVHTDNAHFYTENLPKKNRKRVKDVYEDVHSHFREPLATRLPVTNALIDSKTCKKVLDKRKRICPLTCMNIVKENPGNSSEDLPQFLNAAVVVATRATSISSDVTTSCSSSEADCEEEVEDEDEVCEDDDEEMDAESVNQGCQMSSKSDGLKVTIKVNQN